MIALAYGRAELGAFFAACEQVGMVTNRFGVENEESDHPEIWLCCEPRLPWHELWPLMQRFG